MKCPKCESVDLKKQTFLFDDSVEIDVCPTCGGMWLDKGELDQLDESVIISAEQEGFEPVESIDAQCPSCGGKLDSCTSEAMPKLVVEICRSCRGFWLDKHELEDIREMTLNLESQDAEAIVDVRDGHDADHTGIWLALINFGYSLPR